MLWPKRPVAPSSAMKLFHCGAAPLERAKQFLASHVEWAKQRARTVICKEQQSLIVLFFDLDHLDESREFQQRENFCFVAKTGALSASCRFHQNSLAVNESM